MVLWAIEVLIFNSLFNNKIIVLMSANTTGIVIGIASIVIAILIYFLQRRIRYPGKLKYALVETWKVMSESPNGYGDLSLKYNDYEIKEELNYVKFIVYNNRSYDYSSGDSDNPVRVTLPDGCKWIDAKVVGHSEEIQAEIVNKGGKELDLTFKLLRKNEFIEVDGLMESKSQIGLEDLAKVIEVRHRIPNVATVKNTALLDANEYKLAMGRLITFGIALSFFVFILFYTLLGHPMSPLQYKELQSGEIRSLYVNKEGGVVYHKGMFVWNGYSAPIDSKEFFEQYEPCFEPSHIGETDYFYLVFFFFIFLVLGYLVVWSASYVLGTNEIRRIMRGGKNVSS